MKNIKQLKDELKLSRHEISMALDKERGKRGFNWISTISECEKEMIIVQAQLDKVLSSDKLALITEETLPNEMVIAIPLNQLDRG